MRVALRFDLLKQMPLAFPRFTTAGPVSRISEIVDIPN